MDVDDLTALLAGRLDAKIPAGFRVAAADGKLLYSADEERSPAQHGHHHAGRSDTNVRRIFALHGKTAEDRIVGAAVQVLDDLRDYIQASGQDSWPVAGDPPRSHAQIRASVLHLWYGDHDDVVLACEPIQVPGTRDAECQGSILSRRESVK